LRYYKLIISDPTSGAAIWFPTSTGALIKGSFGTNSSGPPQGNVTTDSSGIATVTVAARRSPGPPYTFCSHPNGLLAPPDPGALNVEFEATVTPEDTPQGGTLVRVHGVGLAMIGQTANLNGQNFQLFAGMGKGLPLANPAQAGLVMQGVVYQCYGNWEGTDQSLDLIVNPGGRRPENGISFNWQPGTTLAQALATTLQQAFPQYTQKINITPLHPPWGAPQYGGYENLTSFATFIRELTRPLGAAQTDNDAYPGVRIALRANAIYVYDAPVRTIQLNFQDLIGQPTWLSAVSIGFKTVLRADIQPGDLVKFPAGIFAPYALTSPTAAVPNAPARSKSAFQGDFFINELHYFANFRQPQAESWNSSYVATIVGKVDPDLP
jgi:hypothetical protein